MKPNLQGKAHRALYDLATSDQSTVISLHLGPRFVGSRKITWNLWALSYLPLAETPPGKLFHIFGASARMWPFQ